MGIRLKAARIDDGHIVLMALEGVDHFGFGTFLCDLKPEEVEADEFALDALTSASGKSGLNGVEIWSDNRIAWGDPGETIIMPVSEISNMGAKWLKDVVPKQKVEIQWQK